jgi:hypothetical protein
MSDRARDDHEKNSHPNGRIGTNSGCDKRIRNSNHLFNHIRLEHELKPIQSAKRYNINPLWRGPRIAGSALRRCRDDFLSSRSGSDDLEREEQSDELTSGNE